MAVLVSTLLMAPEPWQALGLAVPQMRPVGQGRALVEGLSAEAEARLRAVLAALGAPPQTATLDGLALPLLTAPDNVPPDLFARLVRLAAQHRAAPREGRANLAQILARAASEHRAARQSTPHKIRQGPPRDRVEVAQKTTPYQDFFAVQELELRFPRFSGAMSDTVKRAGFVGGDAAIVLPYDPLRDRVLLIEQFRVGPFLRGDRQPWSLEPIAGRIDPLETPEDAARREAMEEAGLRLGALHPVASYYPSPGAVAEYFYTYIGIADLPDGAAQLGGLETEQEDIRGHLLGRAALMALLASGEAQNAPLILSALWLEANHPQLRAEG